MNEVIDDVLLNRLNSSSFMHYACLSIFLFILYVFFVNLKRCNDKRRWYSHAFLIEYSYLVLCFTVICRPKGSLEQLFLIPFYDYTKNEFGVMWVEMLLNVVMFVPIGILLPLCCKSIRWYHALLVGFVFSVIIESLQWTFRCGSCETNDLINNTLGTVIGYLMLKSYRK